MEPQIVNPDPRYAPATLLEPSGSGFIHIAAEVDAPRRPGPLVFRSRSKLALLARLDELARRLEQVDAVERVTVYEAVAIPPLSRFPYVKDHIDRISLPRFDVVVLVETSSPQIIRQAQSSPAYGALLGAITAAARRVHIVATRNAKRIGDVDRDRQGLFLFNYFVADDADRALRLWDHLARWYEVETGLDNSTLLVPVEGESSSYLAINHARWDATLPQFLSRQFLKRSFRTFVQANLVANRVGAMPVLYRLARRERLPAARTLPVVFAAAATVVAVTLAATTLRRGRARWR